MNSNHFLNCPVIVELQKKKSLLKSRQLFETFDQRVNEVEPIQLLSKFTRGKSVHLDVSLLKLII